MVGFRHPRGRGDGYRPLSPGRISLPRYGSRVGLHIVLFEACSAFTRVAACTLALSPIRDTLIEGFSHFVTSMTAPIASGWSGCRMGFAPTGKRRLCTAHATSGHWRACSTAHLYLAISSCEDFLAEALGFLNVENGFSLAIFFESSANGIERIVAMGWLAAFIEQGEMGQGEFFLGLRPKEWCVLAGPYLQRLMKGGDGLLQPSRPFLRLAEDHQRGAKTGFGKSPVEWRAVAGLVRQRPAVG